MYQKATTSKSFLTSEADMRRIYDKLVADNGQATAPLQDTFFGALHGEVTDHINGINWVMNHFRN
ncbi:VOC family protein [Paenibacillus terrigena]|uniref:VOC family protein n=1 Tax=Paenibacillus terrigena TaxID=369333 RepID=UPI0037CA534B